MAKKNSALNMIVSMSNSAFTASTAVYVASDVALKNKMPRKTRKTTEKVHATSGIVMVGSALVSTVGTIMTDPSVNIDYSDFD